MEAATDEPTASTVVIADATRNADGSVFARARPGWVSFVVALVSVGSVALAALFLPIALVTFSAVFGTVSELSGAPAARASWVTPAAFASGTLAACGLAYLLLDHVSLVGYGRARRLLARKAESFLPADPPVGDGRFFVLLEGSTRARRFEDVGCLFVYPDCLRFVGDKRLVTIPRGAAVNGVTQGLDLSGLGLGGSPLTLGLDEGFVRLQSRDADLISQTGEGAHRLEAALRAWLAGDATLVTR